MTPRLSITTVSSSGSVTAHSHIDQALNVAKQDGYLWIDICEPDQQTLNELAETFNLHPLSIEDALTSDQLPKLDNLPNYSFLIFNVFETTPDEVLIHELNLFLGDAFLISVSHLDSQGKPLFPEIGKLAEISQQKIARGPSYLMHLLIDMIVDRKLIAVETIGENLDSYEDAILNDFRDFNLANLLASRRDLLAIRKSLFHERELVSKIMRQDSPFIEASSLIYFRDIYDHLSKYQEMADNARDFVTSLTEIQLSMISNHMAASANRTNKIMRRLTIITTIFMPLSLLSGIGGMSEFTMMTGGEQNWPFAYLGLILVMILIAYFNWKALKQMERDFPDNAEDD